MTGPAIRLSNMVSASGSGARRGYNTFLMLVAGLGSRNSPFHTCVQGH